jgi:hypothetical protein
MRRLLLACGILSSLLYGAMLVLVPLQWGYYSSAAQTVSELSAIGAPTRSLWVPLGMVYTLLFAAFGWGVRIVAGPSRALRVAGSVMIAHGFLGLFWPPMHLRGVDFTLTDALHIGWAITTLLLMMLAMGFAAAALGGRFRLYSITTLLIFVGFGVLTGLDAPRVAADLPTPYVGVWERINIAAYLLWVAVLAIVLLRRREPSPRSGRSVASITATTRVHGLVAPGFEEVRAEFERNFAERGEIGAAVAAYWRGEKVVDLWGGRRTPDGDQPWNEDTVVVVMSST